MSEDQKELLRHFLAVLAYRTEKAVRGAPEDFGDFGAGRETRTPRELVRHMSSVLGYATTFFIGGIYRPEPLPTLDGELTRFHHVLGLLASLVDKGDDPVDLTPRQLLQGPLSDAMTHAGQLAMLRRLAGAPVPSENFIFAEISADNLGIEQPLPVAPNQVWMGKVIQAAWRLSALFNKPIHKTLTTTAVVLLALACAAGAFWTACWSLRFGLTPRPPLPAFQTIVRLIALALGLLLLTFRRDSIERTTYLCAVVAAGASALFGFGLRATALDVIRLLFHFLAYALGLLVSLRWLLRQRKETVERSR
ncbi:MAG: hypothetical protein QOK37_3701 [Thermoanaerobaculia bacterium]|jgi:hypothetical protein|nr:hypothetical protein [Thermoanaerobaculia bacterium]